MPDALQLDTPTLQPAGLRHDHRMLQGQNIPSKTCRWHGISVCRAPDAEEGCRWRLDRACSRLHENFDFFRILFLTIEKRGCSAQILCLVTMTRWKQIVIVAPLEGARAPRTAAIPILKAVLAVCVREKESQSPRPDTALGSTQRSLGRGSTRRAGGEGAGRQEALGGGK